MLCLLDRNQEILMNQWFWSQMVQIPKSMKFIAKIEIFRSWAIHSIDWIWALYGITQTNQDRNPLLMYWRRTVDCCIAFNCCLLTISRHFPKDVHFFTILQIQHVFLQRFCGTIKLKCLSSLVSHSFFILSSSYWYAVYVDRVYISFDLHISSLSSP